MIQKKPHPMATQIRSLTAKDTPKRTPIKATSSNRAIIFLLSAARVAYRRYPQAEQANFKRSRSGSMEAEAPSSANTRQ
jgi:hypothetical protein